MSAKPTSEKAHMASEIRWLDLPTDVTKNILQRLPRLDYTQFAAVCRKWRSIQRDHHRISNSNNGCCSANKLRFPWIVALPTREDSQGWQDEDGEGLLLCLSPFERKICHLPLRIAPTGPSPYRCFSTSRGFLLLSKPVAGAKNWVLVSLVNPATGLCYQLPSLHMRHGGLPSCGAVSLGRHRTAVLVLHGRNLASLFCLGHQCHSSWTMLQLPDTASALIAESDGKFYIPCLPNVAVIDPQCFTPAVEVVEMEKPPTPQETMTGMMLFEIDGAIAIASAALGAAAAAFKADFSKKTWVRMEEESLGCRALFDCSGGFTAVPACDHVGVEEKSIYRTSPVVSGSSTYKSGPLWFALDLRTGLQTAGGVPSTMTSSSSSRYLEEVQEQLVDCYLHWIIPSN